MAKLNVSDVLKSATKKSKPKTEMVELSLPSKTLDAYRVAYDALKEAEADLSIAQNELLEKVEPAYFDQLKTKYVNSARVTDGGNEVTVSWKDAYSKIPTEQMEEIKKILGDKTNAFFKEVNDIKVKPEAATDPDVLEKLINAVGAENFRRWFDVNQAVKPNREFTERRYMELDKKTNEALNPLVKQYAPSIKITTPKG